MKAKEIHFDETFFIIFEGGVQFNMVSQADNREGFWKNPLAIFEEMSIVNQLNKTFLKDFTVDIIAAIRNTEEVDSQHWYEEIRVNKKPEFTILLKCERSIAGIYTEAPTNAWVIAYSLHIFKEQD